MSRRCHATTDQAQLGKNGRRAGPRAWLLRPGGDAVREPWAGTPAVLVPSTKLMLFPWCLVGGERLGGRRPLRDAPTGCRRAQHSCAPTACRAHDLQNDRRLRQVLSLPAAPIGENGRPFHEQPVGDLSGEQLKTSNFCRRSQAFGGQPAVGWGHPQRSQAHSPHPRVIEDAEDGRTRADLRIFRPGCFYLLRQVDPAFAGKISGAVLLDADIFASDMVSVVARRGLPGLLAVDGQARGRDSPEQPGGRVLLRDVAEAIACEHGRSWLLRVSQLLVPRRVTPKFSAPGSCDGSGSGPTRKPLRRP